MDRPVATSTFLPMAVSFSVLQPGLTPIAGRV